MLYKLAPILTASQRARKSKRQHQLRQEKRKAGVAPEVLTAAQRTSKSQRQQQLRREKREAGVAPGVLIAAQRTSKSQRQQQLRQEKREAAQKEQHPKDPMVIPMTMLAATMTSYVYAATQPLDTTGPLHGVAGGMLDATALNATMQAPPPSPAGGLIGGTQLLDTTTLDAMVQPLPKEPPAGGLAAAAGSARRPSRARLSQGDLVSVQWPSEDGRLVGTVYQDLGELGYNILFHTGETACAPSHAVQKETEESTGLRQRSRRIAAVPPTHVPVNSKQVYSLSANPELGPAVCLKSRFVSGSSCCPAILGEALVLVEVYVQRLHNMYDGTSKLLSSQGMPPYPALMGWVAGKEQVSVPTADSARIIQSKATPEEQVCIACAPLSQLDGLGMLINPPQCGAVPVDPSVVGVQFKCQICLRDWEWRNTYGLGTGRHAIAQPVTHQRVLSAEPSEVTLAARLAGCAECSTPFTALS